MLRTTLFCFHVCWLTLHSFGIQSEAEWSKEKSRQIVRGELAISRHCDEIRYFYVVEKKL